MFLKTNATELRIHININDVQLLRPPPLLTPNTLTASSIYVREST